MTAPVRFEVTGPERRHLVRSASISPEYGARFAGSCIDWTQRRRHLNGAPAAAITTRLFELGWIEKGSPGQRRRCVRVTPAGAEGLARTFGLDLMGSCRSCENSW